MNEIDSLAPVLDQVELIASSYSEISTKLFEINNRYEIARNNAKKLAVINSELENEIDCLQEELIKANRNRPQSSQDMKSRILKVSAAAEKKILRQSKTNKALLAKESILPGYGDSNLTETYQNESFMGNTGLNRWLSRHLPFQIEILKIEAQFGTSVASYFKFLRFIFIQFLALTIVLFVFLYTHLSATEAVIMSSGSLPDFMLFSSYTVDESVTYGGMLVILLVLLSVSVVQKVITEDRRVKELDATEGHLIAPMSKVVFCSWDFSISNESEAGEHSGRLVQSLLVMLAENRLKGIKISRSRKTLALLYIRRAFFMLLYLGVQAFAFYIIISVTIYSTAIEDYLSSHSSANKNFVIYAPILMYNLISIAMPTFLSHVTEWEKWDSGDIQINILLFRMYLNSILGALIIAFSYYIIANEFLLASFPQFRDQFTHSTTNSNYTCRVDQAAVNLFVLVLFTFATQLISDAAVPLFSLVYAAAVGTPVVKPEFNGASSMVSLFSFLGIIFLSMPLAPLSLLYTPIYFYIRFKWQYYFVNHWYSKPLKPWKEQRAASVFTIFYLFTLLIMCAPACLYFLVSTTFPKSCDIQDDTIHLCLDPVGVDQTCTLDPSSPYYNIFKDSSYPQVLCATSCGPFIHDRNNIEPLQAAIAYNSDMMDSINYIFNQPYLPWLLVLTLIIVALKLRNSYIVTKLANESAEKTHSSAVAELANERIRLRKRLDRIENFNDFSKSDDEVKIARSL